MEELEKLRDEILTCKRCHLAADCMGPVPFEGRASEIMVIGRNPGDTEDEYGRLFIGRAGKRLDKALWWMGLKRWDVYITNLIKCFTERNRPPELGEIFSCSQWLKMEIAILQPKLILVFRNDAWKYVSGNSEGVTKFAGQLVSTRDDLISAGMVYKKVQFKMIGFPHPSAALRTVKWDRLLNEAALKTARIISEMQSVGYMEMRNDPA